MRSLFGEGNFFDSFGRLGEMAKKMEESANRIWNDGPVEDSEVPSEEGDRYVYEVLAPGVSSDDLSVSVHGWNIVVVPEDADPEQVLAQLSKGILKISVKKTEKKTQHGRRVNVTEIS
jgi:HSP20 family molecular chaperone IbpA